MQKKPKNKQKRGDGFWGESDEQLIDWPKAENGPDDFNESPEMGGALNVAKGTIGEKVAKALNLAKKWLGIGNSSESKTPIDVPLPNISEQVPNRTIFNLRYDNLKNNKQRLSFDYKDSAKWHNWFNSKSDIHVEKVRNK